MMAFCEERFQFREKFCLVQFLAIWVEEDSDANYLTLKKLQIDI